MQVRIELLEDAFWGSGESIPGAEDSSILMDEHGFPYLRGTTFRGVLREEMENYFAWTGQENADSETEALFGSGGMRTEDGRKLYVGNFNLSEAVRERIQGTQDEIRDALTYMRYFTALQDGVAKEGSLRSIRVIRKGLIFYGEIKCAKEDEDTLEEILGYEKWLGGMRTRGLGKVKISKMGGK